MPIDLPLPLLLPPLSHYRVASVPLQAPCQRPRTSSPTQHGSTQVLAEVDFALAAGDKVPSFTTTRGVGDADRGEVLCRQSILKCAHVVSSDRQVEVGLFSQYPKLSASSSSALSAFASRPLTPVGSTSQPTIATTATTAARASASVLRLICASATTPAAPLALANPAVASAAPDLHLKARWPRDETRPDHCTPSGTSDELASLSSKLKAWETETN
ncbi:hypothetical protein CPLU01_00558 [Colletotrichum plurivorum]|uniref:Uncharacterized protein n=1 Tax=Colletotrichum plurivorum TaxID=2175906 RepID=A0A8H6NRT2_9PEZI|nr:hypothetical protein CPLU01_00558 [Colletotrichum plurivorum]